MSLLPPVQTAARRAVVMLALWIGLHLISGSPARAADVFSQNQRLGRGVNIIGYDPIWREAKQGRFKDKHFRLIKEAGFSHVRINLHPFQHMDEKKNWELQTAWWQTLDWAVTQATAQGLMVILDLHEFESVGKDPDAGKEPFLAFWRQVSARYAAAPDSVLFEILNEPCRKMTAELWNIWLREALAIIREKNPDRTVIVGPAFWNSLDYLPRLDLPEDDRNLIVTVHYYLPMEFTHQGASWTGQEEKLGVDWRGTPEERAVIARHFDQATEWARGKKRPLFLGEFGAYDRAAMDARLRYIEAVARAAEAHGWSWSYWQFDGNFIVWDMDKDAWVEPILRVLIPR